jgi:hypothetical protein
MCEVSPKFKDHPSMVLLLLYAKCRELYYLQRISLNFTIFLLKVELLYMAISRRSVVA